MRKRLGVAVSGFAALCAVLWGIGWLLPGRHVARCETRVAQPPERLFAVLTNYAAYPTWRDDVERVEVLDASPGREVVREHTPWGTMDLRVERSEPPHVLVTRVVDPDGAFGGTWTIELTPVHGATHVVITERGEIYSALFRVLSRLMFPPTTTMEAFEKALGHRFSQDVFITCTSSPL